MSNYKEIIQRYTQESDEVIENALRVIYQRSATATLDHLATLWNTFDEKTKMEVAILNAGTANAAKFIALMYGLAQLRIENPYNEEDKKK